MSFTKLVAQNTTATSAIFAVIINTSQKNATQINYINDFSHNINATNIVPEKVFLISADNGKQVDNITQSIASFSITSENKGSFSVSLPSHPITLTNSKNGNTIQVSGWKSDTQTGQGGVQKNVNVINLGASLKMGSVGDDKSGEYTGSYPVTLVYN